MNQNPINTSRLVEVFSAEAFDNRRIDVIGAGATGSKVVLELAKAGLDDIHVYDFDTVAHENIGNQAYRRERDIDQLKVDALQNLVYEATGLKVNTHAERVDGSQELGDIVFLLTDRMDSRKQIFESSIKYNMNVQLMIETRMGVDQGRVYAVNPNDSVHVRAWTKTLCDDVVTETSACGTKISVGPTAGIIANYAMWALFRWSALQINPDGEDKLENELIVSLRPPALMTRFFNR
ncbi:MAG TPA: ThiF family adenylyltransferase [Planktothrix sp.]|jgi:molybdopterin/thiamine biosynthesis adenylyltransferase